MNKKARQWFVALLTLVLLVGNMLPALAAGGTERVAKLAAIKGDVKIKVAGGAKPFKAINNMAVTKGDSLFTGKNSSVQLNLDDGSKIMVGSNAQVMISDLVKNAKGGNQTGVKVQNGQVWSKVKSLSNANDSFKYETPTAVMGIRGTMLFIDASESGSDLWVTEGAVGVAKPVSPEQQDALVIANERIESTFATLRGGTIDAKQLVHTFDPEILPMAAQDIIQAVYEIAGPNPPNGVGKGLSNEFLKQVKEFVEEAQKKDPSITVPEDFPQIVEQVIEQIEEQIQTNPNPPGVTDENSNIPPIPDNPTTPNNGTPTSTGNASGGTTGGSGGGNGGTGGNGNDGGDGTNDGKNDNLVLKEILIEPASLLLQEGKQASITIQAKYTDNTIKEITAEARISSANDNIVTVNSSGVVTAVKAGDTVIHASFNSKQASIPVKVIREVDHIELTPVFSTLKVGKTVSFKASATMTDQTTQDVTTEASWSVTSPEVFWVYPDGTGKAKSVGVTEITASFEGKSSSMTITVVEDIESIGISPAEPEVTVGKKTELKAYSVAEDGSHKTISGNVIWSSSNERVAIVDDKGTVEAFEKGTTTITASYQKWTATTIIKVTSGNSVPKVRDIHITGKPEVGSTLTGSYKYSDEEEDKEGSSIRSWYRADDSNGANKTLITTGTLTYIPQTQDVGKYIILGITPVSTTGENIGEQQFSAGLGPIIAAPVPNKPPVATNVHITGVPEVGSVLTGSYSYHDDEGDPEGSSRIQWYRATDTSGIGKTPISSGGLTYTVNPLDKDHYIFMEVTPIASKGETMGTSMVSSGYGPVLDTSPPAIISVTSYQTIGEPLKATVNHTGTLYLVSADKTALSVSDLVAYAANNDAIKVESVTPYVQVDIPTDKYLTNGTYRLYLVVNGEEVIPSATTIILKYGYHLSGDIVLNGLAKSGMKVVLAGGSLSKEAVYAAGPQGVFLQHELKDLTPSDSNKLTYYFDVPEGTYTITATNGTDSKYIIINTSAPLSSLTNYGYNKLISQTNSDITFPYVPLQVTFAASDQQVAHNSSVHVSFSKEMAAVNKAAVVDAIKTAIVESVDKNLVVPLWSGTDLFLQNKTGTTISFAGNVSVNVTDVGLPVTLTVINLDPHIIHTELFDDDSIYGAGSMLAVRFSKIEYNSLSAVSTHIANSAEFGNVVSTDISIGNTDFVSGLDTLFIPLYEGIPISQGGTFTIPKQHLYRVSSTSYAAQDEVLTIPTDMISNKGIVISPFVDTNSDPTVLNGTITFTKALDESPIKKYTVFLYDVADPYTPKWNTDRYTDGSASYSVSLSSYVVDPAKDYQIVVKPYSYGEHYGVPISKAISKSVPVIASSDYQFIPGSVNYTSILQYSPTAGHNLYIKKGYTLPSSHQQGDPLPSGTILYSGGDITDLWPTEDVNIYETDLGGNVIKFAHVTMHSVNVQLPPTTPSAITLEGSIANGVLNHSEQLANDEGIKVKLSQNFPNANDQYQAGDRVVVDLSDGHGTNASLSYTLTASDITALSAGDILLSMDTDAVRNYFNQFTSGSDRVVTLKASIVDGLAGTSYKTSTVNVDTRTWIINETFEQTVNDSHIAPGEKISLVFKEYLSDTARFGILADIDTEMAAVFGTGYSVAWTGFDTLTITAGTGCVDFGSSFTFDLSRLGGGTEEVYLAPYSV